MPKTFLNDSGKYFGVKIDRNLSWKSHIEYLSVKLNRANALLFKIKNGVNSFILRTINFPIFESNLNYCLFVWSQSLNAINSLVILQNRALRNINFQPRNSHLSPLFRKSFILKFLNKVNLENTLFANKFISNLLPSLFNDWFLFSSDQHNYQTSWLYAIVCHVWVSEWFCTLQFAWMSRNSLLKTGTISEV